MSLRFMPRRAHLRGDDTGLDYIVPCLYLPWWHWRALLARWFGAMVYSAGRRRFAGLYRGTLYIWDEPDDAVWLGLNGAAGYERE